MSHTLIGLSSGEIVPQSGSSIPEKRKHEFDELTYNTFRPTFCLQSKQAAQQPLSLFFRVLLSAEDMLVWQLRLLINHPLFQCERKTLGNLIKESNLIDSDSD